MSRFIDSANSCSCASAATAVRATAVAGVLLTSIGVGAARAHHVMDGALPATFLQGLLSGLGHPLIGPDHLAFVVAMGIAAGAGGLSLSLPGLFVAASMVGVMLHVQAVSLPSVELAVAASVLLIGALVAWGRAQRAGGWAGLWAAFFALAGVFHGHAFGESIVGAEPAPLSAYLIGLAIVQAVLATAVALVARRSRADAVKPRLAGAAVALIGIAFLVGQFLAA